MSEYSCFAYSVHLFNISSWWVSRVPWASLTTLAVVPFKPPVNCFTAVNRRLLRYWISVTPKLAHQSDTNARCKCNLSQLSLTGWHDTDYFFKVMGFGSKVKVTDNISKTRHHPAYDEKLWHVANHLGVVLVTNVTDRHSDRHKGLKQQWQLMTCATQVLRSYQQEDIQLHRAATRHAKNAEGLKISIIISAVYAPKFTKFGRM